MRLDGKRTLGLLIIGLGGMILLGKLGFMFGHVSGLLLAYLIPLALVVLGYIGIRNGSKFFGWLFFVIGLIALASKFAWLIGLVIGIGLIAFGISMLKRRSVT